jgi:hypothetical protein
VVVVVVVSGGRSNNMVKPQIVAEIVEPVEVEAIILDNINEKSM